MAELLISRESGELLGAVDLSNRQKLTFGRSPSCDVRLSAPAVSRRHGLLVAHADQWLMIDTGSKTGIHNAEGSVRIAPLSNDDWLRIGPFYFWLEGDPSADSSTHRSTPAANGAGETLHDLLYGIDEKPAVNGPSPDHQDWRTPEEPGTTPVLHVRNLHGKPVDECDLRGLEKLTIGRSTSCDLTLDDPAISRLHCVLYVQGSRWSMADADSSGGTLVDGRRTYRTRLTDQNLIRIGEHLLWVSHPILDEVEEIEENLARLPILTSDAAPVRAGASPSAFLKPERPASESASDDV